MNAKTQAKKMAQFALEKKAHDVIVMDLRKVTDMTDFFVVCSADSDTQVKAIADAVTEGTDKMGLTTWHTEGLAQRQWVLLDYVDIVVHIFHKDARRFYGLEKIWGDAKIEPISDNGTEKATVRKKTRKSAAPATVEAGEDEAAVAKSAARMKKAQ